MASVTIKNISEALLERIRTRATADKRSMTKEIVYLLETALSNLEEIDRRQLRGEVEIQVEAWSRLAGRWDSDQTTADEIRAIYESRSDGREVKL